MAPRDRERFGEGAAARRTIDMSRDADKARFEPPKASVASPRVGRPAYGLAGKPSIRILGQQFELAKGREQAARQQRAAEPPSGRRHDPYFMYVAGARERERRQGQQEDVRAARCRHTAYGFRTSGPTQVAAAMSWPQGAGEARRERRGPRPATAPDGVMLSAGWDLSRQAPCNATSPRFWARTEAERKRAATPDTSEQRGMELLRWHRARRASRDARGFAAQAIEEVWPHGAPGAEVRQAALRGLTVGRVGYGTLQSMRQAQYEALRSTLKMP